MNKKLIFFFTLVIIPIYLFGNSFINYLEKFQKITYSLSIPDKSSNISDVDFDKLIEDKKINLSKQPGTERSIIESWVVTYPKINSIEDIENFIIKLKSIGITSVINVNIDKKADKTIAVGPFVDKEMALNISTKIEKVLKKTGSIKRFSY
ncbi:MAG: hypothetical protein H8E55_33195 [Pelagibacterales bacterium]|jgi:hypothetical protein|nr:hypothetical protein [Pelagibacterales bacterium]|tara:strand:- start:473 stop:925 length:453 start_codon:yes stop_codon:yes gene_type:complete